MSKRARVGIALLIVHWAICTMFLILRPVEHGGWLDHKEQAREQGMFTMSSGEPLLYVAGRPLYQWNTWHGGEQLWVKILETPNIMPLMATVFLDKFVEVVLLRSHIGSFRTQSWVTGYIFILLSSLQWFFAPWLFIQSRDRMSNATEHL
jgi:hypothetical protein